MAPARLGKYQFRPDSIVRLRKRMNLTQTKMAELIGVPANTLSRWETGATTPDADSLAAIYSIAMDNDITPSFFQRRKPVHTSNKNRDRLVVMWDFQNYSASALQVPHIDSSIRWEIRRPLKRASFQLFKAFASPNQPDATNGLIELGWRVFEDDHDLDGEIVEQAKSDCGQDPSHTTLALISNDGDYVELIQDLSELGVDVYLFTSLSGYNQRLVAAVGKKRWKRLPSSWAYTLMGRASSVSNPGGTVRR
ncbi:MAG: helix-turn-helix domain-containing protein [Chloroflexota bacterium]|nr:helix-turn-helix domain-containing protein [Chloroflexota bacterium]MDE2686283.1 helix-turn-helix domain-containing protein [Chloroflexota bacterium]MYC05921.1 helix-turn-helix domain-containing protein [Chloroflexota bacterium]